MANGLNTIMIKRDISSSNSNNNNNSNNYQQNNNNNYMKIEQSLNNNISTMIKREIIECNTKINNNTIKSNLTNNKSSSIVSPSGGNSNNTTNNNNNTHNCGNTKMGSRRIFTPQFKLQVLESYRNDNDCKGNQRATARKYNIHRRQIQKWLQCEPSLRTAVANLNNQNNNNNNNNNNNVIIKHQFHNISHHHQQQQQSILTNLNSSNNNNNNNQQYNKISTSSANASNIQLSLDSARHSVALNSIQTLSPPLSTSSSSSATTVASMAATTTQSNINSIATSLSSTCSPISIKTPTQINCKSNNNNVLLHHNNHQQQNTMPYLTHTPAINTSVSVPIPIIPTHSAAAAAAAYYHHQYHLQIQHHNVIVTSQHNQHNQHQQNDNCMPPSVSLPVIHHQQQHQHYQNAITNTTSVQLLTATATTNQTNDLHGYQPIYPTTGNPITLSPNYEEFPIARNLPTSQEQSKSNYDNLYNDNHNYYQVQPPHQQQEEQQYEEINSTVTSSSSSPIDLSLGHKKDRDDKCNDTIVKRRITNDDRQIIKFEDNTKIIISKQEIETNHDVGNIAENNEHDLIVDLSCRKRKTLINKYDEIPPEKLQKTSDNITATSSVAHNNDQTDENGQHHNDQQQQPKPVKLFKPYLLDDNIVDSHELKKSEQQDPIIWSHHPSSNYDSQCSSRGSNFHVGSPIEYPFPAGSPIFNHNNQYYQQSHNITSSSAIQSPCSSSADSCCNRSTIVQSPISPVSSPRSPITQTNSQFWCPKGSPVSGYDTASTYSDCSDNYKVQTTKDNAETYYRQQNIVQQSPTVSCSIDIKMHTIDNSYYTNNNSSGNLIRSKSDSEQFLTQQNGLYRNHHVQRWLDHESNADVRHGIAVYV